MLQYRGIVYTIETAVKRKEISLRSRDLLDAAEKILTEVGLVDAWASACVQYGDLPELDLRQPDFKKSLGGETGATFDPIVNHLAESTTRSDFDKRPQRYDRILVKRKDFTVTGFNMFGQRMGALQTDFCVDSKDDDSNIQLSYGSGHWGIKCSLQVSKDAPVRSTGSNNTTFAPIKGSWGQMSVSQLVAYLSEQSVLPSDVDIAMRESALCLLKEVILQDEDNLARGLPAFVLVPVGSYGLGVWTTASDINCLCIGRISAKTFFALAIQRLRKAAWRGIKILRRVDAHSGTIIGLAIGHIRMDLQYCSAVSITETWPAALTLPPTDPIFKLPQNTLAALKPVRDLHHILGTIPDLAAFRLSYHIIKCWAKRRGIYAAQFGYLSGIQISILLSRVCKLLVDTHGRASCIQTILVNFYHHYAGFDWDNSIVFDPFFHKGLSYMRTEREPMAILGFYGPRLNTAQITSVSTAHTIIEELKRAYSILSGAEVILTELLNENTGITEFLGTYKTYFKITARFYGVSLARINTVLEWLESKCASLLVEIGKVLPDIHPRIWPSRFVNQDASEEDEEYEGHYLIGLELKEPTGLPTDIVRRRSIEASLYACCIRIFEAQASKDAKYIDPNTSWLHTIITPQNELGELRLDDRDWGKYMVEAEDEDIGDSEFWASMEADEAREPPTKKETRFSHKPTYEGKLRSAGDVLNRLRWDQAMDSSDYIIGYEDRFSGAMERSVDSWKSDTTHEEFIPEHRILYFKRKSDGTIVWDKEERRDEIFGSGASSLGR
ncbi:Poly(A) polymerase alpha-A [Daldinia childiae]|uniref:Poly(A) polymerase alpha-A n=1 Tax=Daldinia childiae TaxID=326645 RepID=UPI0014466E73|nr:Poly(A) polymerase alpha-A [Daldinia childiae]KAF3064256.1 Poly(A) polymerase alpha-A [Daldinia childiae]